jgi:hypothetical protein
MPAHRHEWEVLQTEFPYTVICACGVTWDDYTRMIAEQLALDILSDNATPNSEWS